MEAGKVCAVTGGANGIGRAMVEAFHGGGAYVAFMDTDGRAGRQLVRRLGEERLLFFHGDAAEETALRGFAEALLLRFRRADYLVNNACVSRRGILSGCSYADFDYVLRLGVAAPYYLTMLLLDSFAPGAAIVNIASSRAFQSQADTESYTAAKGGILSLTHALAVSLAGRVRVNAVCPGWIETAAYHGDGGPVAHSPADDAQQPAGRVGEPKDIVDAVDFLLGGGAGFITGAALTVDGGMTRRMIYHGDEGWTYRPGSES